MALELNRLIKNLANLKHKETNKNKFLKSKAKIQEYKQNVEKAREEAFAIHDYVNKAEVDPTFPVGPNGIQIPPEVPLEANSFKFLVDDMLALIVTPPGPIQIAAIQALKKKLEIGVVTNISGVRYLTTRGRASELMRPFKKMTDSRAKDILKTTGKGKIK